MTFARALVRLGLASLVLVAACNHSPAPAPQFSSLGYSPVLPIGVGNALTLPAQRHLVRIGGTMLLALQQDGVNGHYLRLFRSDDDGGSFSAIGAIQDTSIDRDEADMAVVGQDIAMVYSYEGPDLVGSTAHDVYFQWWRARNGTWTPDPPVRVFNSTSDNNGYYRAELVVDSLGRLWVQSFYLESDGSATGAIAVSTNGGASFTVEPSLVNLPFRGGGRILSLGSRMVFVYDGHDNGTNPTHFRVRNDSDALGTWGPEQLAFGEGIYHGAACSAVADGKGGMHLVYKDKNAVLWYRYFDGASFGPAQLVENVGDWELQPAITRIGDDLVIFYNRVWTSNTNDEVRVRTLHAGSLSDPTILDSTGGFKGYPAAVDVLPTSVSTVHAFFGDTPDANSGGDATLYTIDWTPTSGGQPDLATAPPPDMATGKPADMATPPPRDMATGTGGVLFSDDFNRQIAPDNGLGGNWAIGAGAWFTNGSGVADVDGADLAAENVVTCADCMAQASVITYGTAGGVYLRAPSPTSGDRYDFVLVSSGHVQLRRVRAGAVTVLGDVPSGVSAFDSPTTLALSATGTSPVTLVGKVNGATLLTVSDSSSAALGAAGYAGLWSSNAGVPFDDFVLSGNATTTSGGGTPDMSVPRDMAAAPPDLSAGGGGGSGGGGGGGGSGGTFGVQVAYTDTAHVFMAVDPAGTAYAIDQSDGSGSHLYASTDGRNWTLRGQHIGGEFDVLTALSDGTLIGDSWESSGHMLIRSTDHGATWTDVLPLGVYRSLSPHSYAELDGVVYYVQYQTFTQGSTPIALYASTDRGATWSVRYTFQGHRHGHGLCPDRATHTLWAYFGDTDAQSGIYRSTDGGFTWQFMLGNQDGDVVDATPLPGGGLLFGQDISYLPTTPSVAKLSSIGAYTILAPIIGPSYSIHALSQGGFVVGSERENGGDIYPDGEVSAHLYGSADGVTWTKLLDYPWLDPNGDYVRADVYWELPSTHELVLQLYNAAGFGPNGQGYQLLRRQ